MIYFYLQQHIDILSRFSREQIEFLQMAAYSSQADLMWLIATDLFKLHRY